MPEAELNEELEGQQEVEPQENENAPAKELEAKKEDGKYYTQEQIDQIVKTRMAREQKKMPKSDGEALKNLSGESKTAEQLQQLQTEVDQLRRERSYYEQSKEAVKILTDEGISNIDDLTLKMIVQEDPEITFENAKVYADSVKAAAKEMLEQKYKAEPLKRPPSGNNTMTKEEILAIPNREERQKQIEKNIEIFT